MQFFGKRVDGSKKKVVSEEESTEDDSDTEVEELKEATSTPPRRSLRSPVTPATLICCNTAVLMLAIQTVFLLL